MKSSIGSFALRFAAPVILFAPTLAAQAQGIGQSICRDEALPTLGTFQPSKHVQVCDSVYYPPPPPPAPEPPVRHTTGWESAVPYDPVAEARKAQLRANEHQVPAGSSLCPPPYRMTAVDGCQR
jgi:hypothetical protein